MPHRDPPLAPGHAEAPASAGGPVAAVWRMATRWHSSLRDARTAEGGGGGPRQGRQGQGAGGRALPRRRRGGGSGSGQEPWAAWPSAGRGLREVCDMGPSVNVTSAAWAGRWSGGVPMGSEARPDKKPLGAPPQGRHGVTGPGSLWPCAQLQVTSSQGSVRHVCEGGPPRPPWPSAASVALRGPRRLCPAPPPAQQPPGAPPELHEAVEVTTGA